KRGKKPRTEVILTDAEGDVTMSSTSPSRSTERTSASNNVAASEVSTPRKRGRPRKTPAVEITSQKYSTSASKPLVTMEAADHDKFDSSIYDFNEEDDFFQTKSTKREPKGLLGLVAKNHD